MESHGKAARLNLLDFSSPQMRAFHMSWFAFFLCFFAWFGIAPLMSIVRDELRLTREQIGWTIIASVSITILARLAIGWLCDRYGPRLTYTWLLILGSLPVMSIGLAHNFETFLICRLLISVIGASFVITQYHTSLMFAPNCVGTANATAAGIGNSGGGAAQIIMPLLFAGFIGVLGATPAVAWRGAMVVAGVLCLLAGIAYYKLTQDCPAGNFAALRRNGRMPAPKNTRGAFLAAGRDSRVWALSLAYGACFGVEITIHNIAALYFLDTFGLGLKAAGLIGGTFGLLAIFARTLGGYLGDRSGRLWGLKGRVTCLFVALFCEGLALMLFSQMTWLPLAIAAMLLFGLFVHLSCGATYAIIPFVNPRAIGSVAGMVGAGGNFGAVLTGFLFKGEIAWPTALLALGLAVTAASFLVFIVRFSPAAEMRVREEMEAAVLPA